MKSKLILPPAVMIIFIITIGLLHAQSDSLSQTEDPEQLIPLTMGNKWISELEFSLNGNVMYTILDTILIDTSLEWEGNRWYGSSKDVSKLVGKFLNLFMRNGDGGVWSLHFNADHPDGRELLSFSYPADPGSTGEIDTLNVELISVSESVTVPAGNFTDCYRYEVTSDNGIFRVFAWIKPGIGVLMLDNKVTMGGMESRYTQKLRAYHVE